MKTIENRSSVRGHSSGKHHRSGSPTIARDPEEALEIAQHEEARKAESSSSDTNKSAILLAGQEVELLDLRTRSPERQPSADRSAVLSQ